MNNRKSITKERLSFCEVCLYHIIALCTDKRPHIRHILLFLFIALCPVEDFIFQGTPLRSLGASLSIFPLSALALTEGVQWLLSAKMRVSLGIVICLAYTLLTSAYGLFLFGARSHGEDLLWKSVTSLISLSVIIFSATMDYDKSSAVRTGIYVAFALAIVGFLFGNSNPFGFPELVENGILHFTPLPDARPRGLASEPSDFANTAVIIGLLSIHMARSRVWKTILFLLTLGLLIVSGSKGGILTVFICLIILGIMKWHSTWYRIAALLFAMLPLGLVLISLIPVLFPEDSFASSGTIPTRLSMIMCALMTVAHQPLGVGLTGFLPAVAKYLPGAMSAVESMFAIPLYFTEASDYLTSADMVSTKTFFFDQLMRFGIPFALLFFIFIANLLGRLAARKQTILLIAILFSTIAITTYIPIAGSFAVPIVFGVALGEVRNESNPHCCK